MRKFFLGTMLTLAVGLISPASAIPAGYPLQRSAGGNVDLIEVKGGHGWGNGYGWGHSYGYRPYGWSRGRKVGWGGYGCPPGHWKKGWC